MNLLGLTMHTKVIQLDRSFGSNKMSKLLILLGISLLVISFVLESQGALTYYHVARPGKCTKQPKKAEKSVRETQIRSRASESNFSFLFVGSQGPRRIGEERDPYGGHGTAYE